MCVLTIAVPIFNMEKCLEKNLCTYIDNSLVGRIEVICLNNASEDNSLNIIESLSSEFPELFRVQNRNSRGYGSSINEAIAVAKGKYFKIIDADDWVETSELVKLVDALENSDEDIVLCDYQVVNSVTGEHTLIKADVAESDYGVKKENFELPQKTLPSIHCTTYRTKLLRDADFYMQDGIFFVDEEYVILPYLFADNVKYYPYDIYRYAVANPTQSTSPKNRGVLYSHREMVLTRLIKEITSVKKHDAKNKAIAYCEERVIKGIGDHFTTLYIYVNPRKKGRSLAKLWRCYLEENVPYYWEKVKNKALLLSAFNWLGLPLCFYDYIKRIVFNNM